MLLFVRQKVRIAVRGLKTQDWTLCESTTTGGNCATGHWQTKGLRSKCGVDTLAVEELDTDWIHPWIGLDWVDVSDPVFN